LRVSGRIDATGKLIRVRYSRNRLIPQYLDVEDSQVKLLAEQLIALFTASIGQPRGQLEAEAEEAFGDLMQRKSIRARQAAGDRCDFEALRVIHRRSCARLCLARRSSSARKVREEIGALFQREAVLDEVAGRLGRIGKRSRQDSSPTSRASNGWSVAKNDTAPAAGALQTSPWPRRSCSALPVFEIVIRGESPARYRQLFRQIKFHRLICEVEGHGTRCVSASPRWSAQPVQRHAEVRLCSSPCFFRLFCCAAISP